MTSSRSHRRDEFPAEYSLARCSPAELASASSATYMLQPTTPFVYPIAANGSMGLLPVSQLKGSPQGGDDRRIAAGAEARLGTSPYGPAKARALIQIFRASDREK